MKSVPPLEHGLSVDAAQADPHGAAPLELPQQRSRPVELGRVAY